MRETQLGHHTIRSHGLAVAKKHKYDWLTLVLLGAIDVTLYVIRPVYPILGRDVMAHHRFPIKSDIVPFWAVPMFAVFLPIAIYIFFYFRRRDVYDLHHAILGLLFSILVTAVITNALQDAIGRPRPNFFWHCFPDGVEKYDRWGNAVCHGNAADIKRARESFPSGHVSWSFAGMVFLSLYLSGKIKVFDHEGHVAKLCIVFLPLLVATLVAASRLDDYTHHIQDVLAGAIIGLIVAMFCYLQLFPPPYHPEGWGPYAYFRALEESYSNAQGINTRNGQLEV